MSLMRGLLDRIILLLGVFAAACVPSFIAQYRQRAGGRLDQVLADLAPFQAIADRYHGGSLQALIRYHLASTDPTFHQEGAALQWMVDAAARLTAVVQALNTDLLHQCTYLLMHHDVDLLRSTWSIFQPGFALSIQSVIFAVVVGVVLWALFLGCWHGTARLARRGYRGERVAARRPTALK